jgi:hypothetical protein
LGIDRGREAIEYRGEQESGHYYRIEPGNPAESIILEAPLSRFSHPRDDEPGEDEKHDDRGPAVAHQLPEQAAAVALTCPVRDKHRERRTEAQRVEIKRERLCHRINKYSRLVQSGTSNITSMNHLPVAVWCRRRGPLPDSPAALAGAYCCPELAG